MSVETTHEASDSIATDALKGSAYSVAASLITLVAGFTRSILLARWVAPEHFGVVALGLFYVNLAARLRGFDFGRALIHRQDNSEQVLRTYFTLSVGTLLLSLVLLIGAIPLLSVAYPAIPVLTGVVAALAGVDLVKGLSYIQETLLSKNLAFRALATIDVAASIVMTVVAPWLAWQGWGAWALVAEQASGILVRFTMAWLVFRPWRPHIAWHRETARWFWGYGKPVWGAANLGYLLDRFDDFWIGTALGRIPLGYYSRAYEFARYPRRVVANPLVSVFAPVFAQLQADRKRLSQAFYRAAHVILRSGLLISGAFALIMPEFIGLVIGVQWRPMLSTFRLMLLYTLLDALLLLGETFLVAVGDPQRLSYTRVRQVLFFIPAVIGGAYLWGIDGVALAANAMLIVGTCVLYPGLRKIIDFSLFRLGFWPVIALSLSYGAGLLLESLWAETSMWVSAVVKLILFTGLFVGTLLLTERSDYLRAFRWVCERTSALAHSTNPLSASDGEYEVPVGNGRTDC